MLGLPVSHFCISNQGKVASVPNSCHMSMSLLYLRDMVPMAHLWVVLDMHCTLSLFFKTCGLTVSLLSLTTLLFGNESDLMSNIDIFVIWVLMFLSKLGLLSILDRPNSMC